MRVWLFGGVRVTDAADRTVDIGAAKCRAVLACLALSANKPVTVGRLVESLWGERPPQKADKTLQSYVSLLRSAVEDLGVVIRRVGAAYVLELDPAAVDVLRFEQALDNGDVEGALTEWTDLPLAGLDAPGPGPGGRRIWWSVGNRRCTIIWRTRSTTVGPGNDREAHRVWMPTPTSSTKPGGAWSSAVVTPAPMMSSPAPDRSPWRRRGER